MKQPEALRLADELEIFAGAFDAAAELRRLHKENQELFRALENEHLLRRGYTTKEGVRILSTAAAIFNKVETNLKENT